MFAFRPKSFLVILLAFLAGGAVGTANAGISLDAEHRDLTRQLREYRQRVRLIEQRLREIEALRAQAGNQPEVADCAIPFLLDRFGLKRLRPECVQVLNQVSCDVPFTLDQNGIKRLREECRTETAASERR